MKPGTLILLSGAALAMAACNRDDAHTNADATNLAEDNAVVANDAAAAAPTTAQGFANAAAASDRFEIESSNLAATASQSAGVKAFAAQMVRGHTESSAKLKSTVASMSPPVTLAEALNPTQQQMLDGLKGKSGADFDAAYKAAQVTAHQATLDTLNAYASSGDNAALRDFARGLIPTVTAHLNMAKSLK